MFKNLFNEFGVDAKVLLASLVGLVAVILSLASGPAAAQSGNVYRESGGQAVMNVQRGFVLQLREVRVAAKTETSYLGKGTGAALGGLIGATLGGRDSTAGAGILGILGAALGGAGGQVVAENMGGENALEILVETQDRFGNTTVIGVVQPLPGPDVQVGQAVLVLNEGGKNRVVPSAQTTRSEQRLSQW